MSRLIYALLFLWCEGCLVSGCIDPLTASKLFGKGATEAPEVTVEKTARGFRFKSSKDVQLGIDNFAFNPVTGEITLGKATLTSAASPVLDKYPAWIGSMLPAQQANFQWAHLVEQERTRRVEYVASIVKELGGAIIPFLPQLLGPAPSEPKPSGPNPGAPGPELLIPLLTGPPAPVTP